MAKAMVFSMEVKKAFSPLPVSLTAVLPDQAVRALSLFPRPIGELRLSVGKYASVAYYEEGGLSFRLLPYVIEQGTLSEVFSRVCDGSVYAFEESIREGYICMKGGIRVGIGGHAVVRKGKIYSLSAIHTLVFRIPDKKYGVAARLAAHFQKTEGGILLFAPPGGGKTTLLRDLIRTVTRGENAVKGVAIDTRGELGEFDKDCLADLLLGYPKAEGVEIAVRTLSPRVIFLDELGRGELDTLSSVAALGVRVVATVHSRTVEDLRRAPPLRPFWETGVFETLWDVRNQMPHRVVEA